MKLSILLAAVLPMATALTLPTQIAHKQQQQRGSQSSHRLHLQQQQQSKVVGEKRSHAVRGTNFKVQRENSVPFGVTKWVASAGLGVALLFAAPASIQPNNNVANAYDPSDYASETVQTTIKALKDSAGNAEDTYKVYEEMNSIITEGKGVGGAINYKGVQLERGYVADEDTTIYNPGLTLLTESEKERLVESIVANRKFALQKGDWPESNQLAFEFLREKLDPFHVAELRGYLQILPFYAAAVYLGVLAVQQFLRDLFPAAYIVGVVAIFVPAIFLVALGP